MRAILVGLVVGLVTGIHLLVEIVVTGLMIEHTTHTELRDKLGIVIAMRGIIALFSGCGLGDHGLQNFLAGHVAWPACDAALVGFAGKVCLRHRIDIGNVDLEAVARLRVEKRKLAIGTVEIGHGDFQRGTAANGLLQAIVKKLASDLAGIGNRIGLVARIALQCDRIGAIDIRCKCRR